jgi:protoheme IX farnesyltransferase
MLPVVHGDRATVIQIAVYTVLTAVVSVLPLFMNSAGFVYLVASILLNAVLFVRSFQLYRRPEKAPARVLFKYSMVYLAVLFLTLAIDRATVL